MRVGLDARHVSRGLGIGTFTHELCSRLVQFSDLDVIWFGDGSLAPEGIVDIVEFAGRAPYPFLDSALGQRLAARSGLDVFHFTGNTGWARPGPVPFVLTVQDMIFMRTKPAGRTLRQVVGHAYERRNLPRSVKAATVITVPSEVTAQEMERDLEPASTPVIIPLGVDEPPVIVGPPLIVASGGDDRPYVVAFSGRDPRKGVDLALEGFRRAASLPYRLRILTGAGLPRGFEEQVARELADGSVELLGYQPRRELWELLRGASALIYPSLEEGFGLPVLEAMAVGVPVITGLAAATREVGGDAIIQIDPAVPAESIGYALERIHSDGELRDTLVQRGLERSSRFAWDRTADAYRSLYIEAAREDDDESASSRAIETVNLR